MIKADVDNNGMDVEIRIREMLSDLNISDKPIDVHVHLFPDDIVKRMYAWIEKKHKMKAAMKIEYYEALNYVRKLRIGTIFNLTHSIVPELTDYLNRWQGKLKKKYGFITFGAFHPENSDDQLIDAFDRGYIDGLKLHPPVQKFRPDSKEALRIYELLEELKKPLFIHAGWFPDNGFLYADSYMYEPLIHNYSFPVIIAHMIVGKSDDVAGFLDARKNVYTETANALVDLVVTDPITGETVKWFGENVRHLIEEYPDRIMYGSEIPLVWWNPAETIKNLLEMDVDDSIKKKILLENAKKFIEKYIG